MGFLKKIIPLIVLIAFLEACSITIIKVKTKIDPEAFSMFGSTPQRNFFVPESVSDSLKLKWETSTSGGFANTSVTINDSLVFIGDLSGKVYAFNFYNGKEIGYLKDKGAVYTAPIISKFLIIYAVAIPDDNESILYFYDFSEGTVFRDIKVPGRIINEIVSTNDGYAAATEDGQILKYNSYGLPGWKIKIDSHIHVSPAFENGMIILGDDDGEIICVDNKEGKIIYKNKIGGHFLGGVSIKNGTAFLGNDNGTIYAVELKTGKISWQFNTGARVAMTPAFDDENVYAGNLNGDFFALGLKSGKVKWKFHSEGLFNVTPLITNNFLFIPDLNGELHIISKVDGKTEKTLQLDGRAKLTPVLYKNILFIGFDRGVLQAYEFEK